MQQNKTNRGRRKQTRKIFEVDVIATHIVRVEANSIEEARGLARDFVLSQDHSYNVFWKDAAEVERFENDWCDISAYENEDD